jgi:hypothetical protein
VGNDTFTSWHQDGSFMGTELRTVNLWSALNACGAGTDSPGLGVLPARFEHVLPTGTDGSLIQHSVGERLVTRTAGERGVEVLRPHFEPGDTLLFDQFFLHTTWSERWMETTRYALELWCFTPSSFPPDYVPLAL